ncbi:hypothetical protein L486_08476 [Kwoniella mangroviensis CBS 10435]|uniref:Uncharacterized protein n=1 Tax=Kwoniella mangroviensis CBS 10435 TaxID=1331196 RepID=A0A1B9IEP4_9TREE|nr:hypothetical protein L486_08476 [Kwoniella mangroviensis CBS 10435]
MSSYISDIPAHSPSSPLSPKLTPDLSSSSRSSPQPPSLSPLALDRFPPELRIIIFDHITYAGPSALFNLILTCQAMYDRFTPLLYTRITVDQSNAEKLFYGIIPHVDQFKGAVPSLLSLEDQLPGTDFAIAHPNVVQRHARKVALLDNCRTLIIADHQSIQIISSALGQIPCTPFLPDPSVGHSSMVSDIENEEEDEEEDPGDDDEDGESSQSESENDEDGGEDGGLGDNRNSTSALFSNLISVCFENTSLFDSYRESHIDGTIYDLFIGVKPQNVCATYDTSMNGYMASILGDIGDQWTLKSFTWHDVTNPDFSLVNSAKYLNYHISSINTCAVPNHQTRTGDPSTATVQQGLTPQCTCPITLLHMTDFVYRVGPSREPPTSFDKSQKAKCNYVGLYNIPEHYSPICWSELERELKSKIKNQPIRAGRVWSKNEKDRMKRWKEEFGSFLVDSKKWVDCPCCGRF